MKYLEETIIDLYGVSMEDFLKQANISSISNASLKNIELNFIALIDVMNCAELESVPKHIKDEIVFLFKDTVNTLTNEFCKLNVFKE